MGSGTAWATRNPISKKIKIKFLKKVGGKDKNSTIGFSGITVTNTLLGPNLVTHTVLVIAAWKAETGRLSLGVQGQPEPA